MSATIPVPQHRRPLWSAVVLTCFIAPLAIGCLQMVVLALVTPSGRIDLGLADVVEMFAMMMALYFPLTVVGVLVLGVPMTFWLRRRGRLTVTHLVLAGAVGGISIAALFYLLDWPSTNLKIFWFGIPCGVVVSFVFALMAGVRWRKVQT